MARDVGPGELDGALPSVPDEPAQRVERRAVGRAHHPRGTEAEAEPHPGARLEQTERRVGEERNLEAEEVLAQVVRGEPQLEAVEVIEPIDPDPHRDEAVAQVLGRLEAPGRHQQRVADAPAPTHRGPAACGLPPADAGPPADVGRADPALGEPGVRRCGGCGGGRESERRQGDRHETSQHCGRPPTRRMRHAPVYRPVRGATERRGQLDADRARRRQTSRSRRAGSYPAHLLAGSWSCAMRSKP